MARTKKTHVFTETELIFRKNITYLREKTGLTRSAFIREMRLNQAYYYRLENLNLPVNVTFEYMQIMAEIHNIPVWKLFTKLYEQEEEKA